MGAPIGNTCPDIDTVITAVKEASKEAKHYNSNLCGSTIDNIQDAFGSIEYNLDGIIDIIEELRSANSALRDWGEECEEKILDLEEKLG